MRPYKDLKERHIESRSKETHSHEIDGTSLFSGHRFILKTKLFGDKRCIYCGKWFHWKDTDMFEWFRTKNIDDMNKDGATEPLHCGSLHCQEYHRRYLKAQETRDEHESDRRERIHFDLFRKLKKEGAVV